MFKSILFVSLLLVAVTLSAPVDEPSTDDLLLEYTEVTNDEWEAYKKKFEKKYEAEEDAERRKIYDETKKTIAEHNKKYKAGEVTWTQGINQFADKRAGEVNHGLLIPTGHV